MEERDILTSSLDDEDKGVTISIGEAEWGNQNLQEGNILLAFQYVNLEHPRAHANHYIQKIQNCFKYLG